MLSDKKDDAVGNDQYGRQIEEYKLLLRRIETMTDEFYHVASVGVTGAGIAIAGVLSLGAIFKINLYIVGC